MNFQTTARANLVLTFPGRGRDQEIIENLAALGYDQSDMFLAAYDWRLSYYNLQVSVAPLSARVSRFR